MTCETVVLASPGRCPKCLRFISVQAARIKGSWLGDGYGRSYGVDEIEAACPQCGRVDLNAPYEGDWLAWWWHGEFDEEVS